jgi:hypothetical protein
MDRTAWKTFARALRSSTITPALGYQNPRNVTLERIEHGGTYWSVRHIREAGKPASIDLRPSIITDRPASQRIAEELAWSRHFRTAGKARVARGVLDDARAIRPAFHTLP